MCEQWASGKRTRRRAEASRAISHLVRAIRPGVAGAIRPGVAVAEPRQVWIIGWRVSCALGSQQRQCLAGALWRKQAGLLWRKGILRLPLLRQHVILELKCSS